MRVIVLMCLLHAVNLAQPFGSWLGSPSHSVVDDFSCTANEGYCGCCAMVQQVDKLTKFFDTHLYELEMKTGEMEERLKGIEERRVAFSAALYNTPSMKCFTGVIVNYMHVFINLGGGYNESSGIFTAPYSGVYSLAVTVYSDAGTGGDLLAACASLQINGEIMVSAKEKNKQDQEDSASIVLAYHLTTGDQVSVNMTAGCLLCDDKNHYNTFSVFLLYPTGNWDIVT